MPGIKKYQTNNPTNSKAGIATHFVPSSSLPQLKEQLEQGKFKTIADIGVTIDQFSSEELSKRTRK